MLYFDHNATTPLLPQARLSWLEAAETLVGNPSSPHRLGQRAEAGLNRARKQLADILGCHPFDLVWTSGATESNNLALHHLAQVLPASSEVWLSAIEHPSVLQPATQYFPGRVRLLPVRSNGVLDPAELADWVSRKKPGAVALMAANNETGILQPWLDILSLCRQQQIAFLCDAVQWLGKMPAAGLGQCDFVSGSAHKFGGPKGVGFLKCPSQPPLRPLLYGGPQEDKRRAGTENVPGIVSMLAALTFREQQIHHAEQLLRLDWRHQFEARLLQALPECRLVGGNVDRLWNTVSVVMPPTVKPVRWVVKLDKAGYAVSTGSACSSGKEEPSHVLAAMGLNETEASRVLRLSSGWETLQPDWEELLEALIGIQPFA